MHTVVVIQARMSSSRLPGKVLMPLAGESMLARVVRRVGGARRVDRVLVATSTAAGDDPVAGEAARLGVDCFRGSLNDVLDRFLQAARWAGADRVVRVTADCPLIDPGLIDRVVDALAGDRADYASNFLERAYPRGLDCEAMTLAALAAAGEEADQPYQREHVTPYLYQHPEKFRLASVRCGRDLAAMRWTVDTAEDLEFVRGVYGLLGDEPLAGWETVLALVQAHPELAAVNRHVRQKELGE